MNTKPDQATRDAWHNDPKNWRFGIFYYDKEDKRLLPPKRFAWMGWTVNFANPWSYGILILILALAMLTRFLFPD